MLSISHTHTHMRTHTLYLKKNVTANFLCMSLLKYKSKNFFRIPLSNMGAISYMWLLNAWNSNWLHSYYKIHIRFWRFSTKIRKIPQYFLILISHWNDVLNRLSEIKIFLKLISLVAFYLFHVAARIFKIIYMVHIVFLLDRIAQRVLIFTFTRFCQISLPSGCHNVLLPSVCYEFSFPMSSPILVSRHQFLPIW